MFVTEAVGTGDLGSWTIISGLGLSGLAAGDKICQLSAEGAGLASGGSPVFRAWLSTESDDAFCHIQGLSGDQADNCGHFGGDPGPWYRTDGVPFSDTLNELVAEVPARQQPLSTASRTEHQNPFAGEVWTGTQAFGGGQTGFTCGGWTISASGTAETGLAMEAGIDWTEHAKTSSCSLVLPIYCFEDGPGDTLLLPIEPSALAFLTTEEGPGDLAAWTGSGGVSGVDGADNVCEHEAAAKNLAHPYDFRALLAGGTTSVADRFPSDIGWVRADGVRVANSTADFSQFYISADLRGLDGTVVADTETAWTGSNQDGSIAVNRCNDWTSAAAADHANAGRPWRSDSIWLGSALPVDAGCNVLRHLYCFGVYLVPGVPIFAADVDEGDCSEFHPLTSTCP